MAEQKLYPQVELVKARLREFYREPGIVFWVFGFPLLMAMGLGVAFRSKESIVPLVGVVVEKDEAPHRLERALLASDRVRAKQVTRVEAKEQLARTKLDIVVNVGTAHPTTNDAATDDPATDRSGKDSVRKDDDKNAAEFLFDPKQESGPIAKLIADKVLQEAAGRKDPIKTVDVTVQEKGSRYIDFLIPGLIGMNLMGSSMWGVGFNLVVARKRKLLRRYAVTPMRRLHFLLSYFFSRSLFLVVELTLLVAFGMLMFETEVQGGFASLFAVAVIGAAAFAGISLMVAARLDNTETANGWMNFVQLPMYVLSGTFFAYERFPSWMHTPIELLPLTALVNAVRSVYNEGAHLAEVLPEVGVLSFWCLLGFGVALRTFRWQ